MNLLDVINTRRSIRKFTGEVISDQEVEIILQAGFQAPSAMNREPREYIVVRDKDTLDQIEAYHPHAKMLSQAGCAIVVCGDKNKQNIEGFLSQDCSASVQNILLAAHTLDLGAVWCGVHPRPELVEPMVEILGLPEHIIPIAMVVVGRPDQKIQAIDRYNKACVRYEKW